MSAGGFKSKISKLLPEARQVFAQTLRDLYTHVALSDGKRTSHAEMLKAMEAGYNRSSLCRYFNGKNVPSEAFTVSFYALLRDCTTDDLPLSCEDLLVLRARAAATDGRRSKVREEIAAQKDRRIEELEQQLADKNDAVALPVPAHQGDRQSNAFEERPAPQAATEVIELTAVGLHEQALTLLSRLSEHHEAAEVAQCVAHFRTGGHDELADTLIQIYGRDHQKGQHRDVIRMSITLRGLQFPDDADNLLNLLV
ncbi:hypothetical protein [Lentzea sp. CA-135723]|uniref:hypothetical protein n=1 Tax=Lentzea sp. CA-135723 TaxID=3239950 RepID=UPI003D8FDB75